MTAPAPRRRPINFAYVKDAAEAGRAIHDLIVGLSPIHEATERFARGGPDRAREIERLFNELRALEDDCCDRFDGWLEPIDDDDDDDDDDDISTANEESKQ